MNDPDVTQFVVRELGKHRSANDVVRALIDQTGMTWGDAQKVIRQVQVTNRKEIAGHQAPWIVIVGVLTIIGGLVVSAAITLATLNGVIIFFIFFPIPYLGNIVYFVGGLLMALGGIVGIARNVMTR